jgi:hypothetical protein
MRTLRTLGHLYAHPLMGPLLGATALALSSAAFAAPSPTLISPTVAPIVAPLSEAEADAALSAARSSYSNYFTAPAEALPPVATPSVGVTSGPDGALTDTRFELAGGVAGGPANVALEDVQVVIDVENASLQNVLNDIVRQAAANTGPWQVKWRLKPENMGLLTERVNLTAEAPFGQFIDLLTERVRNLSGTNLYVTSFPRSRVLLVADTYY